MQHTWPVEQSDAVEHSFEMPPLHCPGATHIALIVGILTVVQHAWPFGHDVAASVLPPPAPGKPPPKDARVPHMALTMKGSAAAPSEAVMFMLVGVPESGDGLPFEPLLLQAATATVRDMPIETPQTFE
jgi:hypothetical protein